MSTGWVLFVIATLMVSGFALGYLFAWIGIVMNDFLST